MTPLLTQTGKQQSSRTGATVGRGEAVEKKSRAKKANKRGHRTEVRA
jgi:hypothetical protein